MRDESAEVNGVQIAYQLHGNPDHLTIMLVHGLSTPLTGWPKLMIAELVPANFQVLLLDNRDMGRALNSWTILLFRTWRWR